MELDVFQLHRLGLSAAGRLEQDLVVQTEPEKVQIRPVSRLFK